MTRKAALILAVAGMLAWLGCTAFYAAYGPAYMETAFWFYAVNAALCAAGMALLFRALGRVLRVGAERQMAAAACFCLPVLGLALMIAPAATSIFSRAAPETLGRYAAYLLFALCGVMLVALSPRKSAPAGAPAR